MAKQPHTYTLQLTQAQFFAVADALEFTSRFTAGQIEANNLPIGIKSRLKGRFPETVKGLLKGLKRALFPDLAEYENLGVGHQPGDESGYYRDTLYEVYRTMLEFRTQEKRAAGQDVSLSVYDHPGLQYTNERKPVVKAIDQAEAKKAFIDEHFPKPLLRALRKQGIFTLEKPTYEQIEEWVCKHFGLESIFDYGSIMDGVGYHLSLTKRGMDQLKQQQHG
ncbi:hypothetical protein FAES_3223 [Fibrella aestuarina BUZ 2]|uniref:Uncharacterized protein n=1 Tax=Fibrella aestuarina BUZ 2 TaxID=1166018 RepID=I0KAS9_9BACT|nr:hypothetical protein [Fibrella aestuarina]CCH01232.1 hypothetical protein FAES_3223 [Fibrella aestuarina BUZ 2]